MKQWDKRTSEVAYLFNPAFCGGVIYKCVKSYQEEAKQCMPYPLSYLILPIILHKNTRVRINSISHMKVWLQKNPDVLINFALKAKNLVIITNEAVEFLLQQRIIEITNDGISIIKLLSSKKINGIIDAEIKECFSKAEHVGKWFARSGAVENIYNAWGG